MIRRLVLPVLVTVAALAVAAPHANAGVLVSSATGCDNPAWENPFLPWLDPANYVKAPGGTFDAGPAWAGGAVVPGNESFEVAGDDGTRALSVPAGDSATSPAMCVGIDHPTLRFFVKRSGGDALSTLQVEVLFEDALGNVHALPIGAATGDSSWAPTPVMVISASLLPLLPNDMTAVAFRFTPQDSASWKIDDVYVDPYIRR